MNVNPNKSGWDAFSLGSNLMSYRSLRQMFDITDESTGETTLRNMSEIISGRSITMFDVETTGIFKGSQVVQMAAMDISPVGIGSAFKVSEIFNTTFKSPQLGGLMYGQQGQPFSDLFGKTRKNYRRRKWW